MKPITAPKFAQPRILGVLQLLWCVQAAVHSCELNAYTNMQYSWSRRRRTATAVLTQPQLEAVWLKEWQHSCQPDCLKWLKERLPFLQPQCRKLLLGGIQLWLHGGTCSGATACTEVASLQSECLQPCCRGWVEPARGGEAVGSGRLPAKVWEVTCKSYEVTCKGV